MNAETKDEGAVVQHELDRVISAARDSMTDEMVGRLAGSAAEALDLVDKAGRAGLSRAIPALAEMVNNGDLERLSQLARVYHASQDALTDEMVSRLTEAVGGGLSLLDQVNRSGLEKALPIISRMAADGDLERLSQLARVYSSAQDALTDEMVGRLAETLGEGLSLLDRLNRGGAGRLVEMLEHLQSTGALERIASTLPQLLERLDMMAGLLGCLESAASKSRAQPAAGGIGSLWRIMTDEKTLHSLQFLLAMGEQMQEHCAKPK
ncbi:MAG: hypothetical protein WB870_07335 [Gallionellaceae bacterium]